MIVVLGGDCVWFLLLLCRMMVFIVECGVGWWSLFKGVMTMLYKDIWTRALVIIYLHHDDFTGVLHHVRDGGFYPGSRESSETRVTWEKSVPGGSSHGGTPVFCPSSCSSVFFIKAWQDI